MTSPAVALGKDDGITLTRVEYLGPHGHRRVLLEFDPARAVDGQTPWRVRVYALQPHAHNPAGETWKLARRRYHRRSVAAALSELRSWLVAPRGTR